MVCEYKVVAVSENRNEFGLRGIVVIGKDGSAWQFGSNDNNLPEEGHIFSFFGEPSWSSLGFEIPERLSPDPPPELVNRIWPD